MGKSAKYSVTINNVTADSKSQMLLFESVCSKGKRLLEEKWEDTCTTNTDTWRLLPILSNIEQTVDKVFFLTLCDKALPRLPDFKVNLCHSIYREQRTQTRLSNWIPLKAIQSGQRAALQYNGFPDWLAGMWAGLADRGRPDAGCVAIPWSQWPSLTENNFVLQENLTDSQK
jgi:hypothetical protein